MQPVCSMQQNVETSMAFAHFAHENTFTDRGKGPKYIDVGCGRRSLHSKVWCDAQRFFFSAFVRLVLGTGLSHRDTPTLQPATIPINQPDNQTSAARSLSNGKGREPLVKFFMSNQNSQPLKTRY
jgi:hypothetical protein